MKSIWLVLISIMIFGVACNNYAPKHEKPTIPQEEMANIAADIHIIEAHAQNIPAKDRDSVKSIMYDQLFKIHKIEPDFFYENQQLYYKNPDAVEKLYIRVSEVLDEREKSLHK